MPARNSVDLRTYLGIALKTSGMSAAEVTQKARLKESDLLDRVLRGEALLPLESAAKVAKVLGKDPGFIVQLAFVANHPEIWAVVRHQPDCLLGYNERVWMRLYWRVSPLILVPLAGSGIAGGSKRDYYLKRRKSLSPTKISPIPTTDA